jgi:enoyl-CoA hydratase/carnithine racemase
MADLQVEINEKIAIVKLDRGVTNPISLGFIKEISEHLESYRKSPEINGIVITSNNEKFFSIGFDLPELYNQTIQEVEEFYKAFNRLCLDIYTYPKPTIAAISGHAIAGGCIITICCDYRYISDGRKLMGLNEIKLGLPVPYPSYCILEHLVGSRSARYLVESGDFFEPDRLVEMGLVDEVLPQDQVLPRSVEKTRAIGEMPNFGYEIIKRNRIEDVERSILAKLEEKEKNFLKCWQLDEVRVLLAEAVKKF